MFEVLVQLVRPAAARQGGTELEIDARAEAMAWRLLWKLLAGWVVAAAIVSLCCWL